MKKGHKRVENAESWTLVNRGTHAAGACAQPTIYELSSRPSAASVVCAATFGVKFQILLDQSLSWR